MRYVRIAGLGRMSSKKKRPGAPIDTLIVGCLFLAMGAIAALRQRWVVGRYFNVVVEGDSAIWYAALVAASGVAALGAYALQVWRSRKAPRL